MINIEEINAEIERLENCDCTTYSICEKLAMLYTVRDHFMKKSTTNNSMPAMKNAMSNMTTP